MTEQNDSKNDKNSQNDSKNDSDSARIADFKVQLSKHENDAIRLAESLHTRVYNLRQRAQAAEAQLPGEGQAVIPASDVDLLAAYKKIGTPKEIGDSRTRLVQLEKYRMVSDAAEVAGMNPRVLSKLLPNEAELKVGEATDNDGKAKQIVNVVIEGQEAIEIGKYASTNWTDFLPALQSSENDSGGKEWIQQSGTKKTEKSGLNPHVQKRLDRAAERATAEKPLF